MQDSSLLLYVIQRALKDNYGHDILDLKNMSTPELFNLQCHKTEKYTYLHI